MPSFLSVCTENKLLEACVFLQCLLELWMPAVELALSIDANLAEKTASQTSDRDLQRKLWLRIAEHEIKGKNDVAHALELLNKCSLLQIEDLLPFFDDFQKIDHFKEAICEALEVKVFLHYFFVFIEISTHEFLFTFLSEI